MASAKWTLAIVDCDRTTTVTCSLEQQRIRRDVSYRQVPVSDTERERERERRSEARWASAGIRRIAGHVTRAAIEIRSRYRPRRRRRRAGGRAGAASASPTPGSRAGARRQIVRRAPGRAIHHHIRRNSRLIK